MGLRCTGGRRAFEWLVDAIEAQQQEFPSDATLSTTVSMSSGKIPVLDGQICTRQEQIDGMYEPECLSNCTWRLLSVRASVEEYSLKRIEAFYGFAEASR